MDAERYIYPESIKATIIDNHFLTSDIGWVLAHFTEQSETIQSAFIRQAKANFSLVSAAEIDSELIPIPVYAMCLDVMDLDQAEKLHSFLPDPNFEAVCTSAERQKFPCTEDVRLILGYFKQNGWIDSYRKHREHYLVTPKQREAVEV